MASIIIEGCDGVGKTSLARLLQSECGYEYLHFSAPKSHNDAKEEYGRLAPVIDDGNFVCDRFMLGEKVYAPMLRGYYPLYMGVLEEKMKNSSVILINCPLDIHIKQFDGKFINEKQLSEVSDRFRLEFKYSKYPNKKQFINDSSKKTLFEEVLKYAKTVFRD